MAVYPVLVSFQPEFHRLKMPRLGLDLWVNLAGKCAGALPLCNKQLLSPSTRAWGPSRPRRKAERWQGNDVPDKNVRVSKGNPGGCNIPPPSCPVCPFPPCAGRAGAFLVGGTPPQRAPLELLGTACGPGERVRGSGRGCWERGTPTRRHSPDMTPHRSEPGAAWDLLARPPPPLLGKPAWKWQVKSCKNNLTCLVQIRRALLVGSKSEPSSQPAPEDCRQDACPRLRWRFCQQSLRRCSALPRSLSLQSRNAVPGGCQPATQGVKTSRPRGDTPHACCQGTGSGSAPSRCERSARLCAFLMSELTFCCLENKSCSWAN